MIKTDLHCTNLLCRFNDQSICVTCIPHYPGQKIIWCSMFAAKEPDDLPIRYQLVEGVC